MALATWMLFASQGQAGETWNAAGHSDPVAWVEYAGRLGAGMLLVLVAALLIRAFLRRHLYRATDVLSESDLERVHESITAAEKKTVGEIVPIVVERSDAHPGSLWLAAVIFVLLGSALFGTWLPWDRPVCVLLAQIALGAAGYFTARALPDFQRLFVRESRATEMAEEQAFQEFYRYGLHKTQAQTGVLIFVSLFERRVTVLADEGVDAHVEAEQWASTDQAVLEGIAGGSLRDGLIAGIESAAAVLEEHFPWEEGDRNEIPDRLIVRRE